MYLVGWRLLRCLRLFDTDAVQPLTLMKAPASLEEIQVDLHCWAREGLDTGPPLSPAWCACIARLARCVPINHPHQRCIARLAMYFNWRKDSLGDQSH